MRGRPPSWGGSGGEVSCLPTRQVWPSVGLSKLPGQTPWCHRRLSNDAATCGRTHALQATRPQRHLQPSASKQVPPTAARSQAVCYGRQDVLGGRHSGPNTAPSHRKGHCGQEARPGRGARAPASSSACSSPQPQTVQTPLKAEPQQSAWMYFFRLSKYRPLDRRILTSAGSDSKLLSVKRTDSRRTKAINCSHVWEHLKGREVFYPWETAAAALEGASTRSLQVTSERRGQGALGPTKPPPPCVPDRRGRSPRSRASEQAVSKFLARKNKGDRTSQPHAPGRRPGRSAGGRFSLGVGDPRPAVWVIRSFRKWQLFGRNETENVKGRGLRKRGLFPRDRQLGRAVRVCVPSDVRLRVTEAKRTRSIHRDGWSGKRAMKHPAPPAPHPRRKQKLGEQSSQRKNV